MEGQHHHPVGLFRQYCLLATLLTLAQRDSDVVCLLPKTQTLELLGSIHFQAQSRAHTGSIRIRVIRKIL
jgi:hypothetical protein